MVPLIPEVIFVKFFFVWLASGENTLRIKWVQKGASDKDGRLANGLPFVVRDMSPIVVSNRALHGRAGLVHVGCANRQVVPAVFLGPKDLEQIEVWMFKWPREGIRLTGGGTDRLLQHLQGTKRNLRSRLAWAQGRTV